MLTKQGSRNFFILGTALCSGAFILLTIDTFKRIPEQTNQDKMTESVVRGKHLWDKNNCMGCHTLFGEGAYYAPELTKVYSRRGETFIKLMLEDPERIFPGERKMQKYNFSKDQINDLVSFFEWIDKVDTNGFPPTPDLMGVASSNKTNTQSMQAQNEDRPAIFDQMCVACHQLDGQGGAVGPALDGVGHRKTREELEAWLQDPAAVKSDSKMPKLPLSESDIAELATFLSTKKNGANL